MFEPNKASKTKVLFTSFSNSLLWGYIAHVIEGPYTISLVLLYQGLSLPLQRTETPESLQFLFTIVKSNQHHQFVLVTGFGFFSLRCLKILLVYNLDIDKNPKKTKDANDKSYQDTWRHK